MFHGLTENDMRLLKAVSETARDDGIAVFDRNDSADYQAYQKLSRRGLVEGNDKTKELMVRLTEDGKQALRDAHPSNRARRWILGKLEMVLDHSLTHIVALVLGGAVGWLLKTLAG